MSEDIYAKPDLTKKVRFQSGAKANEKADVNETTDTVHIYDNYVPEGSTPPGPQDSTTEDKQTGIYAVTSSFAKPVPDDDGKSKNDTFPPAPAASVVVPSGGKNRLRHALWLLALLCLLFLAVVLTLIVLLIQDKSLISNLTRASDELWTSHGQMESRIANLTMYTTGLEMENDHLKVIKSNLTKERDQLKTELAELACCSEAWMKIGNSCYFLPSSRNTYIESKRFCENLSADLVIISNSQEERFVSAFCTYCWIGLKKRESDNTWIWVDGSENRTPNWGYNQPSNSGGNEGCVQILSNGQLNDIPCTNELHFICEK